MLEDLSQALLAGNVVVAPKQSDDQLRLLARIKRAVRRKTGGGILKLAVLLQNETIVLRGNCTSFYCKQVAQETAMSFLRKIEVQLLNEIEVSPPPH
jgi:hypothetical protein